MINLINSNYWYSYILFLIIIGGLIILFIYFTSIASNSLINFNINFIKYFFLKSILFTIFFLIILFFNSKFIYYTNFLEILNMFYKNFYLIDFIAKNLYIDFSIDLNIFILTYLFITIIRCVLLCTKFILPFRQLNYGQIFNKKKYFININ